MVGEPVGDGARAARHDVHQVQPEAAGGARSTAHRAASALAGGIPKERPVCQVIFVVVLCNWCLGSRPAAGY